MEENECFACQWQTLQKYRQELFNQTAQLQIKLNNFSADPQMSQLLKEKSQLKKKAKELLKFIAVGNLDAEIALDLIEMRKLSKSRKEIISSLENRFKNKFILVNRGLEENSCDEGINKEWGIETTISEIEENYREIKQKVIEAECNLKETLTCIASIENNYYQSKKCLEEKVREMERQKKQCRIDEIEWATQDSDHLKWILEHEPSYRNEAIVLYKTRFSDEALSDLIPENRIVSAQKITPAKIRHARNEYIKPSVTQKINGTKNQDWEFLIASSKDDLGIKLPSGREEFTKEIRPRLPSNIRGLKLGALYEKLIGLTKMNVHQRQLGITKIIEPEFHGWQRLKIGGYRILIFIDENLRQIRFILCKKGYESYVKNY